jgi:hypothetical protein
MSRAVRKPEDLDQIGLAKLVVDLMYRTSVHHALWFGEVVSHLGMEAALPLMDQVWRRSYAVQMERLSRSLGFAVREGIPSGVADMPKEALLTLMEELGKNWLAGDGLWFQAVEASHGMTEAKCCNDSCWERFSPFEAFSIKRMLELPDEAGLDGLKRALDFRLYARINKQSIEDEGPASFLFRMDDCRVQSARKRKCLPDYPCKSAGLVEYRTFAETIDPRIRTDCVACPPDPHPEEWFCAWRFSLVDSV